MFHVYAIWTMLAVRETHFQGRATFIIESTDLRNSFGFAACRSSQSSQAVIWEVDSTPLHAEPVLSWHGRFPDRQTPT